MSDHAIFNRRFGQWKGFGHQKNLWDRESFGSFASSFTLSAHTGAEPTTAAEAEPPASTDPPTREHWPGTVTAPLAGVVVELVTAGEHRPGGGTLAVLEAMKMEHEVLAEAEGVLDSVEVAIGQAPRLRP